MFHKENSSISSQGKKGKDVPLRKSDRKRLLETANEVLHISSSSNTHSLMDDIFLKGSVLKRTLKLPNFHSVHVYLRTPSIQQQGQLNTTQGEGNEQQQNYYWPYQLHTHPIWFELEESRSAIYQIPGLALLALLSSGENCTSTVTVNAQASKFICRGANVMRAGILKFYMISTTSSVAAVNVLDNPQPFAVGILHPDLQGSSDDKPFGPGTKGIGVTVVQSYGDDWWRTQATSVGSAAESNNVLMPITSPFGASFDGGDYGNVGFLEGRFVVPILQKDNEQDKGSDDSNQSTNEANQMNESEAKTTEDADGTANTEATTEDVPEQALDDLDINETTSSHGNVESSEKEPSHEEIVHASVCKALVSLNPKKQLPMLMATFYAQHVLSNRPEGTTIQLKQTKYKKFGVYVAEQVERGLIKVGPDSSKKDKMAMLIEFDRHHPDLHEYFEQKKAAKATATRSTNIVERLVLADLYCVPNHFIDLMRLGKDVVKAADATSVERRNTGMLTLKESRAILENYIEREQLIDPSRPDHVQLDGPLTDVLFKKKKKAGSDDNNDPIPTSLSRKDIMNKWQSCQEPAYCLVELPGNNVIKLGRGKPPVVTIEISRRQSKKFVTKVSGLEAFGVDPVTFCKDVAHRFACSATTSTENTHYTELLFQGNLADELEALLLGDETLTSHGGAKRSTYHLPKNAVSVILRKGVPARKKRNTTSTSKK